jgi:hypothetical protein
MEQKELLKQMIEFNKTTFDNAFSTIVMMLDQTEQMVNSFMDQSSWLPEDGKKALNEWVNAYKKARDDFKKSVDESYKRVQDFFA